jgi:hypothetical protein
MVSSNYQVRPLNPTSLSSNNLNILQSKATLLRFASLSGFTGLDSIRSTTERNGNAMFSRIRDTARHLQIRQYIPGMAFEAAEVRNYIRTWLQSIAPPSKPIHRAQIRYKRQNASIFRALRSTQVQLGCGTISTNSTKTLCMHPQPWPIDSLSLNLRDGLDDRDRGDVW